MSNMMTRDFSDVYPSVPQLSMIEKVGDMIDAVFQIREEGHNEILVPQFKRLDREPTRWSRRGDDTSSYIQVTAETLKSWVSFVIMNTACEVGGEVFWLVLGIPIGTNAGRELLTIFLSYFELTYTRRQCELRRTVDEPISDELLTVMFSKRFVDDIWFPMFLGFDTEQMLYDERAEGGSDGIYPSCLQGPMGEIRMPLNLQLQDQGPVVPFLDVEVHFDPDTRVLWWHHYDKRDHIAAFRGTHTFPHPKSRLQVRSKTGTLTSAMHS